VSKQGETTQLDDAGDYLASKSAVKKPRDVQWC